MTMNLTKEQREILSEQIWEDFEIVYDRYETDDFLEVHGSTGGDSYINRYYFNNGQFTVYGK